LLLFLDNVGAVSGLPSFGSSLLLLAALAGCHDPLTQVVVVFQSDLDIPTETDGLGILASDGPFAPDANAAGVNSGAPLLDSHFPLSIGVSSAGATSTFSMTVLLLHGFAESCTNLVFGGAFVVVTWVLVAVGVRRMPEDPSR
jgi:hypothetical protein